MAELRTPELRGCWSSDDIAAYLDASVIPLRLAVQDGSGSPWVMSLWFLYEDGAFWCATRAGAKLLTYLQKQGQCGFEVASDMPPYKGIRGKGTATITPDRGADILPRLLQRYGIDHESALAKSLLAKIDREVAIRIAPSWFSSWDFTARMSGALPEE